MATDPTQNLPLPEFVHLSIFPFEGDLRVRSLDAVQTSDEPRSGEPGGGPCHSCSAPDEEYIWVDEHWRVMATEPSGVPTQLFLETRAHLDMDQLDNDRSSELGQLIVRLDRAIQAVGGVGRVHLSRWGDGGSHFHMWFYARPLGSSQLRGFCLPMWAMILPPTPEPTWNANLAVIAAHLATGGGHAMVR